MKSTVQAKDRRAWRGMISVMAAIAVCALISPLTGCGEGVGDGKKTTKTETSQQTDQNQTINPEVCDPQYCECKCSGTFTCPTDGWTIDYDQPGCGLTRTQAANLCRTHCGSTQCTDSGWFCIH